METKIIALSDPPEAVFAALCTFLEDRASELHRPPPGGHPAISSLVRVVLSPCGTLQIGAATLPLIPVSPDALQRRFRLTPTQVRVAALLAARLTNAEIAQVLGRATSTVRTHVAWVFGMLGVHHRDEVAYVLSDPSLQSDTE